MKYGRPPDDPPHFREALAASGTFSLRVIATAKIHPLCDLFRIDSPVSSERATPH